MPELDRYETATAVSALFHYAVHVAVPEECIRTLDKLSPHPDGSWSHSIYLARRDYQEFLDRAEAPVVRDPESWRAVAAEGRRHA